MKVTFAIIFMVFLASGAVFWFTQTGAEVPTVPILRKPTPTLYSAEFPPSESLGGLIASFSGEVLLQERMATEGARIYEIGPVLQGEALESGADGYFLLEYPDVLSVEASQSSELEVIQTLPDNLVFYQKAGSVDYERRGDNPVTIRFRRFIAELGKDASLSASIDPATGDVNLEGGTVKVGYNDADFISHIETLPVGSQWIFYDETRNGEFVE